MGIRTRWQSNFGCACFTPGWIANDRWRMIVQHYIGLEALGWFEWLIEVQICWSRALIVSFALADEQRVLSFILDVYLSAVKSDDVETQMKTCHLEILGNSTGMRQWAHPFPEGERQVTIKRSIRNKTKRIIIILYSNEGVFNRTNAIMLSPCGHQRVV